MAANQYIYFNNTESVEIIEITDRSKMSVVSTHIID